VAAGGCGDAGNNRFGRAFLGNKARGWRIYTYWQMSRRLHVLALSQIGGKWIVICGDWQGHRRTEIGANRHGLWGGRPSASANNANPAAGRVRLMLMAQDFFA